MDMTTDSLANVANIRQYLAQRISSHKHPLCLWTDYDHPVPKRQHRIGYFAPQDVGVFISLAGPLSSALALRFSGYARTAVGGIIGDEQGIRTIEGVKDLVFVWHHALEQEFDTPTLMRKTKTRRKRGRQVVYEVNFFAGLEILQNLAVLCHDQPHFDQFAKTHQIF